MGSKHLFVLIHGLWGNHNHMKSLMEVYGKQFGSPEMVFFSPSENALFKTFDGIEIIGYRTLLEIYQFIKCFKDGPITKISVLGYSMGGLVARFVLGKMFGEYHDLFEGIEPQIFITMATPHLGVQFYNPKRYFFRGLMQFGMRLIGSNIIGKSGRELFVVNKHNDILVRLGEGEYLDALSKFKWRVAFANVNNDRSVAFYTGFISDCDPFINTGNQLKYAFEEEIPGKNYTYGPPRIIDLDRLDPNCPRPVTRTRRLRKFGDFLLFFTLFGFVFLPLAICINITGTIYSHLVNYRYRKILNDAAAPSMVRQRLQFNNSVREFTEDVYRTILGDPTESVGGSNSDGALERSDLLEDSISWKEFIQKHTDIWKKKEMFAPLPFDENRKAMYENLNSLEWIRIPVYIKMLNSHGAMVARRGLNTKKSGSSGIACVEFSARLLQYLLAHSD
ncbi:hypothetical protein ZYGR_0H05190 [Zygosaccharomyces rouxii]|uniref:ZYRO0B15994p n=2 Tax=Zygosaccharomyces rouxii TaxID=4956 RepID=C5DSD5_ZYGRC|nr:uncharacterized protein ZYRO0B15994g [Zygosaccharomyces rouxii]KAH9199773.1 putative serine esterase-domain-containing protein [Zygosaccharomyces rouxii]GAV47673.1 hypothetical protein ZYGR_0H05190 [Zygosaccharomyces rouxii]CAR26696.1 ZYRO0B15994p [Zygosaccharomyces rouxii]